MIISHRALCVEGDLITPINLISNTSLLWELMWTIREQRKEQDISDSLYLKVSLMCLSTLTTNLRSTLTAYE